MKNRFFDIAMSGHTEFAELWLGICHLVWGLWILSPFWSAFQLDVYQGFIAIAPEWVWGIASVSIGLYTIAALLCRVCFRTQSFWHRRAALFLNSFVWFSISFAFAQAAAVNSGQLIYFMLGLLSIWLTIRVRFRGNPTL